MTDATSSGQLNSKKWILEVLQEKRETSLGVVFVCAGWYGLLPNFLLNDKTFSLKKVYLFDWDPLSIMVSEDLNHSHLVTDWHFKSTNADILSLDYHNTTFETLTHKGKKITISTRAKTIINTSCEHLYNFSHWWDKIPPGTMAILQSNDYFGLPCHTNCHPSLEAFKKSAPMKKIIYEGTLDCNNYKRFMLIGTK